MSASVGGGDEKEESVPADNAHNLIDEDADSDVKRKVLQDRRLGGCKSSQVPKLPRERTGSCRRNVTEERTVTCMETINIQKRRKRKW